MKEYIQKLRALADRLEELGDGAKDLDLGPVVAYLGSKENLATKIRTIGGKWNKKILSPDREYSVIEFTSEKYPIRLTISRDAVCKKIVKYECEPIFAPGEDDALLEEVSGL